MVRQIPISVKLDAAVFADIQFEMQLGYCKRNRFINEAVKAYIRVLETRRVLGAYNMPDVQERKLQLADELLESIYFYK